MIKYINIHIFLSDSSLPEIKEFKSNYEVLSRIFTTFLNEHHELTLVKGLCENKSKRKMGSI